MPANPLGVVIEGRVELGCLYSSLNCVVIAKRVARK